MNCCGDHSHSNQKDNLEDHNIDNAEKKKSWIIWVVVFLIILLIFSFLR